MMDMGHVSEEVQRVLAMLDPNQLPGVHEYLTSLSGTHGAVSPYGVANTLLGPDKPKVFPPFLADFILELFQAEIAAGNDDAMNDLGALYYTGDRGFQQSFEKAIFFYQMAADRGNRQARENLGYCYYYGRDGKPDYERAFHCFAPGAFEGHLISLYKIGDMYLNGLYVPKDEQEAYSIFTHCIERMTPQTEGRVAGPVYLRLGKMFLEGTGVEQDFKSALFCCQKAERFLYDMVKNGEAMYRKSLDAAIEVQEKARGRLAEELPDPTWRF